VETLVGDTSAGVFVALIAAACLALLLVATSEDAKAKIPKLRYRLICAGFLLSLIVIVLLWILPWLSQDNNLQDTVTNIYNSTTDIQLNSALSEINEPLLMQIEIPHYNNEVWVNVLNENKYPILVEAFGKITDTNILLSNRESPALPIRWLGTTDRQREITPSTYGTLSVAAYGVPKAQSFFDVGWNYCINFLVAEFPISENDNYYSEGCKLGWPIIGPNNREIQISYKVTIVGTSQFNPQLQAKFVMICAIMPLHEQKTLSFQCEETPSNP